MNTAVTEPEVLTDEQEEAALQALLDKADAKKFGEPEPEPADDPEPDPMKLTPEPGDEPNPGTDVPKEGTEAYKEPATDKPEKTGDATATPAKYGVKQPDKEAAKPAAPASPKQDDEDDDAKLLALVPEGPARDALKARLAREADARSKLAQDNRSMAGRVSAYQRRYEEATGKRQPAAEPVVTPEQKQEWKTFASEFPEIAKAIEAKFAETLPPDTAAKTAELLQYVEKQKREQFLQDAWAAVDAVHPTWRDDGRTKEFQAWKQSSSTYEKLAASDDIADAIALFDLYASHKGRTKVQPPAEPAPASTAAADQAAARREKQAEGAVTPSSKPASPNQSVDLNDQDQLFAFYAKNADSRIKRRYN